MQSMSRQEGERTRGVGCQTDDGVVSCCTQTISFDEWVEIMARLNVKLTRNHKQRGLETGCFRKGMVKVSLVSCVYGTGVMEKKRGRGH